MNFALTSESFRDRGAIPARYTCDGWDMSPPLAWTAPPAPTRSLVLIVDDPDAAQGAWVHWLLYNLPPEIRRLPEDLARADLPPGCLQGRNDWGRVGYGGPCPPHGCHRYRHRLYALDALLPDLRHPARAALEAAMAGHVLARAELVGLYQRRR